MPHLGQVVAQPFSIGCASPCLGTFDDVLRNNPFGHASLFSAVSASIRNRESIPFKVQNLHF
jgi:hypothetical protein